MTKRFGVAVFAVGAAFALAACGSSGDSGSTTSAAAGTSAATSAADGAKSGSVASGFGIEVPEGETVAVTLITKDSINPFFVAMQEGAQQAADQANVSLTIAAGKEDGDEDGQVQAIENAVSRCDKGILIVPNGPGVNPAIEKTREAGLFVIALDTPPDPADTVDITFATDNFKAGESPRGFEDRIEPVQTLKSGRAGSSLVPR
jgi:fructose transport system substrate-binding protein